MNRKCPECGCKELAHNNFGEVMCKGCGLVIEDTPIEEKPFISESTKNKARQPMFCSAGGSKLDGKVVKDAWFYSTKEKNIKLARRKLEMMESRLKLPDYIVKESIRLFRLAVEEKLNVGRDNLSLLYASVYASCLMHCIPKTPLEIILHSDVSKKKMMRSYKLLKEKLNLNIGTPDIACFIQKFGNKLELDQKIITKAIEIINKPKIQTIIAGKHPQSIVASALYVASKLNKEKITQRQIANTTGVIEITIRKRSREIMEELGW